MANIGLPPGNLQGWNGLTIKELLDRVDIEGPKPREEAIATVKTKTEPMGCKEQQSAYLGPKLWDKPLSLQPFQEDDFFVMNIEEFLAENNLQADISSPKSSPEPEELSCTSPSSVIRSVSPPMTPRHQAPIINIPTPTQRPSIIVSSKVMENAPKRNSLPKGQNEFLYTESKRARMEREREEKRKRLEVDIDFAPEDLALATVPGADFDPRRRAFDVDELRPQPIIRKRHKIFVGEQAKDERYWTKRTKNNVAARRSREARRLKENQIALRAAYLEKENQLLKKDLEDSNFMNSKLAMERDILKQKLTKYEIFPPH